MGVILGFLLIVAFAWLCAEFLFGPDYETRILLKEERERVKRQIELAEKDRKSKKQ